MSPLTKRRDDAADRSMIGHVIGNAHVVRPRHVLRDEIRDLALGLAADPDHELVVVDLPMDSSFAVWESTAKLLPRKRRGVRLVIGGRRSRETTALAGQWLSERLNCPVIAPDGSIMRSVGGSLFVDAGWGTGWVRFQPGKPPKPDGKRFPRPAWETAACLIEIMPTSAGSVAEPLPGGVWLRPRGPESVLRAHRKRLVETLPCQPDVCVVVLGCPGAPPITIQDITRFWSWLPDELRAQLRLAKFGPLTVPGNTSYYQNIADTLGEQITCYTGIPVGSRTEPEVYTLRTDGTVGWRAFAEEMTYTPAVAEGLAMPPALRSYCAPVFGVKEIAPAVYQYAPDVVLEVVQSGLWLRPPYELPHAPAIRSVEPDAERHLVLFEDGHGDASGRLRELAEDVLGCLVPATRHLSGLVRAESVVQQRIEIVGQALGAIEASPTAAAVTAGPAQQSTADPGERPAREPGQETDARQGKAPLESDAPLSVDTVTTRLASVTPEALSPMAPPMDATSMQSASMAEAATHDAPPAVPAPSADPPPVPGDSSAVQAPVADLPVVDAPGAERPRVSPVQITEVAALPAPQTGPPPSEVASASMPPTGIAAADAPAVTGTPAVQPPAQSDARQQTAAFVTIVQPTPSTAAAALVPKRGLDEERAWLRRTLSREYAAESNSVSRVLSEHPGFQGALERSSGGVLSDAVAIRLYLSGEGDGLDLQLRMGAVGPHVPFARCVVSGLSRLPSHRGATVFATSPTPQEWELYRSRKFFTEWGFINALSAPCAKQRQTNDVDVLVWSMTARRTKLLEPELNPTADRVLFVPGTSFKVLDLTEPEEGVRGQVLLRELAANEIDSAGRVDDNRASLDELALNSLRRCLDKWAEAKGEVRVADAAAPRFSLLPGLVRTTSAPEEER
ncbi:hypothetical protein [Saccharopolyspora elongata]|uniref:Uncharacterized protein n=1 Tax=Saccharopolyspora elongata TaxID=2530387 RepID=A0A4R4YEU7_9PSEU|nr:hypothetical protein [Saccharopolyspora elongata]TDD42369.1 hypothetical protein E1288_29640 [Saccharopolyspora elongata]